MYKYVEVYILSKGPSIEFYSIGRIITPCMILCPKNDLDKLISILFSKGYNIKKDVHIGKEREFSDINFVNYRENEPIIKLSIQRYPIDII